MNHRRYYIRSGARTTADGVIKASSAFWTLGGLPLAREGDPVDCPACGTRGVVECAAPRLSDRFDGKEYALSDDLCACACSPPPRLIAEQYEKYQLLDAPVPGASVA